jgi:transcriptional regulator with XRE-family HTH domain
MTDKKKGRVALAFGEFIRDQRRALRLTQQEVADAAGIDRTLLSDYERPGGPEHVPTDATLFGLAKALQVDPELLFDYAEVGYPSVDISVSKSAPAEIVQEVQALRDAFVAGLAQISERLDRLEKSAQPEPPKRPRGRRPATPSA